MEVGLEKGDLNWMMLALLDDEFQEKAIKNNPSPNWLPICRLVLHL